MRNKKIFLLSLLLLIIFSMCRPGCSERSGSTDGGAMDASFSDSGVDGGQDGGIVAPCTVGWAIGSTSMKHPYYAVILKYDPATGQWTKQFQHPVEGSSGCDISAVDQNTAWAAICSAGPGTGAILHTVDGTNWVEQAIPDGGQGSVKGIKGLNRNVAWAATLDGIILNTTDGNNWNVVIPNTIYDGGLPINTQVNRIDAYGEKDVWIVYPAQGSDVENWRRSILHKYTTGNDWRLEELPPLDPPFGDGVISISALNQDVVWCSRWGSSSYDYRTLNAGGDAGTDWLEFKTPYGAMNDTDDICAASENSFWGVINNGMSAGYFDYVDVDGGPSTDFQPAEGLDYVYGGVSCCGSNSAWVVGNYTMWGDPPDGGNGVVVKVVKDLTADGGWKVDTTIVESALWKVSFVGATR